MSKGVVHPKMKIRSFSTHPHVSGLFSPQNTAGVSQEISVAVITQTTEASGNQISNVKTKQN